MSDTDRETHAARMKELQVAQSKRRRELKDPERGLVLVHTGDEITAGEPLIDGPLTTKIGAAHNIPQHRTGQRRHRHDVARERRQDPAEQVDVVGELLPLGLVLGVGGRPGQRRG